MGLPEGGAEVGGGGREWTVVNALVFVVTGEAVCVCLCVCVWNGVQIENDTRTFLKSTYMTVVTVSDTVHSTPNP